MQVQTGLQNQKMALLNSFKVNKSQFSLKQTSKGLIAEFVYPTQLSETFRQVEEIKRSLKMQADKYGSPEMFAIYQFLYIPLKSNYNEMIIRCRVCRKNILVSKHGEFLKLYSCDNRHSHPVKAKSFQEKYLRNAYKHYQALEKSNSNQMEVEQPVIRDQKPVKSVSNIEGIDINNNSAKDQTMEGQHKVQTPTKYTGTATGQSAPSIQMLSPERYLVCPPANEKGLKNLKQDVEPTNFYQLLSKNGFWLLTNTDPQRQAPQIILAFNTSMSSHGTIFGDVVSLEFVDSCVMDNYQQIEYKLALFTVFDMNCRTLIASCVLYRRHNIADMFLMLKFYLKSTMKRPSAIITSTDSEVLKTMQIINQIEFYKGIHIIDKECILQQLQGIANEATIKCLNRFITTGNTDKAAKILEELCNMELNPRCETIIADLIQRKSNICTWALPPSFVGLSFSSRKQVKELANSLPKQILATQFIKIIIQYEAVLSSPLCSSSSHFEQPFEDIANDLRLRPVRHAIQSNVYKAFLKNYMIAMAELQFCSKNVTENQQIVCYVAEKRTSKSETITEGRCSCKEDIKTGIPCPHVICCLKEMPGSEYLEAFDLRWRRDKITSKTASQQTIQSASSKGKKGSVHS